MTVPCKKNGNDDLLEIDEISYSARIRVKEAMAEEDAFLVDDVEGGLCVDNTDAGINGRCNSGSNKDKGKAKELWDSFESKYMAEDSSSKKFLKDFKHTLKHGKDDLSLVQLGSHLRIEESLRAQESDKGKGKEVVGPSVNMMEKGGKNKNNKQNKGKKRGFKDNNGGSGSNKKPKLECWKCGKTGYFKRDCRSGNKKNNASAGGSGKGSKDQSHDQGTDISKSQENRQKRANTDTRTEECARAESQSQKVNAQSKSTLEDKDPKVSNSVP
ncbi:zinc finger, CCHC-type containing protein [Tanacetum coccineum]|uniref:Zinc finger, CCHC-type containing protein n=1 Tax=Tanacetum coccineum TaxID=301880 RepID=A0ABQ5AN50_9ASTR